MVLVAGGFDSSFNALASAELYDPASGTWTPTGSLNTARGEHTATLLPNGMVLAAGGFGASGVLASAELYETPTPTPTPTSHTYTYAYANSDSDCYTEATPDSNASPDSVALIGIVTSDS